MVWPVSRAEKPDQPGLAQLVEDHDPDRDPDEDRPSGGSACGPAADGRGPGRCGRGARRLPVLQQIASLVGTLRGHEPTRRRRGGARRWPRTRSRAPPSRGRWHRPGPARRRGWRGSRQHAVEVGSHGRGQPLDPQVDPVVERQRGVPTKVLDRALQLARIAFGPQLRGELGVDDHHQAVAVGHGRAGPGRGLDLDLVGGQGHAAQRHRAVRVERRGAVASRGHHGRDRGPQSLADLRQERLDAALDQVGVVGDDRDLLDVDLVGDDREQVRPDVDAPVGQGEPGVGQRLAGADAGRAAERAGEVHRILRDRHRPLQASVAVPGKVGRRPGREMHGVRTVGSIGHQVPVHRVGQERQDRGEHPGRAEERLVERRERRGAVGRVVVAAHPLPRQPHVPGGETVHEARQLAGRRDRVEGAQVLLDRSRGPGRTRQDPAVERAPLADRGRLPRDGRPVRQARVRHEERVDVPEHQQLAARLVGRVPAEQDVLLRPRLREHPAHDVHAHPLGGFVEVDRVAPRLVHRPAVLAEDQRRSRRSS